VLHASGFETQEGRSVTALFARQNAINTKSQTLTTTVKQGRFDVDFLFATSTCSVLGVPLPANCALYIDVDGNEACDPKVGWVFVWSTFGDYPAHTCWERLLTPCSPRCDRFAAFVEEGALAAAQELCPVVTSLDF
jgi:hypothetical protein